MPAFSPIWFRRGVCLLRGISFAHLDDIRMLPEIQERGQGWLPPFVKWRLHVARTHFAPGAYWSSEYFEVRLREGGIEGCAPSEQRLTATFPNVLVETVVCPHEEYMRSVLLVVHDGRDLVIAWEQD